MKFKSGDIVYCIDTLNTSLKLDNPYIISEVRIFMEDLSLRNDGREWYWLWSRFITEKEYNIKKVVEII